MGGCGGTRLVHTVANFDDMVLKHFSILEASTVNHYQLVWHRHVHF